MKTKDVLQLDCRQCKNQKVIQRVLRQIKPLSKFTEVEDIPLSAIEKAIQVMDRKYGIGIKELEPDTSSNKEGTIWRATLQCQSDFKVLDTAYGLSLYEALAKSAIRIYAEVRRKQGV